MRIGTVVEKYRIVAQLGRGSMGVVYRAVDQTLDREVAIKVLNPDVADPRVIRRFRSEATTLARLSHSGIATIYDLVQSDTDLLIVMELVRGETLEKIANRVGPFPPEQAAHLVDEILSALQHAHRAGIVHCDIKPANVVVNATGGLKILDFGTARVLGAEKSTIDRYTMGTPAYMPPEQVMGHELDGRADLYAVGVILYRLLTGTLPFHAQNVMAMMQKQMAEAPPPLAAHRSGLPDWCETVVQRALAKAPEDRFQTAEAFRETLHQATGMVAMNPNNAFAIDSSVFEKTPAHGTVVQAAPTAAVAATVAEPAAVPRTIVSRAIPLAAKPSAPAARAAHGLSRRVIFECGVLAIALAALWRTYQVPAPAPPASAPAPVQQTVTPAPSPPPAVVASAPADVPTTSPAAAAPPPAAAKPPAPLTGSSRGAGSRPPPPAAAKNSAVPPPSAPPAKSPSAGTAAGSASAPLPAVPLLRSDGSRAGRGSAAPLVFEAKALVDAGDRQRERDCRVVLAEGRINVQAMDDRSIMFAVPYEKVSAIAYSRGRDPMWNAPGGPARVGRGGRGALGLFRGTRHWLALRIADLHPPFVVFRFGNDVEVNAAIRALEERTGRTAQLVVERPDR